MQLNLLVVGPFFDRLNWKPHVFCVTHSPQSLLLFLDELCFVFLVLVLLYHCAIAVLV